MRIVAALAAALAAGAALAASAASAEPAGVTSAYTKLDLDRCEVVDNGETPQSMEWRCGGHAGLPLFVQNGDDRYDVDAGLQDEDAVWDTTFDYPGDTVEWRLKSGVPFAIIYRLRTANPDVPAGSSLVVETIGKDGKHGCRVAKIDGAARQANQLAREAADALLSGPAACLTPE
jgi:hypothetical protein